MKKESEDVISMIMGANPIKINSALVSAQNRNRLYWTNIEGVQQPEDKGILLKDIIHETEILEDELILCVPEATKKGFCEVGVGECVDLTFLNSKTRRGRLMKDKSNCLTAANYEYNLLESLKEYIVPFDKTLQILDKEIEKGTVGFFRKDSQGYRVYFIHGKSITLNASSGGLGGKTGLYLFGNIIKTDEEKGNVNKFYTLTNKNGNGILIEGYIRKLTPIECERLQTVPDNYTEGVSNSQRYKMLGNGWTVDIICHILCNM
jgi:DNA (cytosine-5)-methyltransferase 3A